MSGLGDGRSWTLYGLLVAAACCTLLASGEEPVNLLGPRIPHYRFNIPKEYTFYDTKVIPEDHQVNAFLYKGDPTMFFFLLNQHDTVALSFTVTPCTSSIAWTLRYRNENNTGKLDDTSSGNASGIVLSTFTGRDSHTFSMQGARQGLYTLQVASLERETYVNMYASLQPPFRLQQQPKLRLQRRHKRNKLTVRWEHSLVDPFKKEYCLVVNTRRHYASLCEAQGERYGVMPPALPPGFSFPWDRSDAFKNQLAAKAARLDASRLGRGSSGLAPGQLHDDIMVGCVGRRTSYTLSDLQQGKVYHLDLFAINNRTLETSPFGSATLKYDQRTKAPGIRDGRAVSANIRQMDGRAAFRYKVGPSGTGELEWHVMPCGGAVEAEVRMRKAVVVPRVRVDGYLRLRVPNPLPGQRYVLRLSVTDPEELRRITAVEVMATRRTDLVPSLPEVTRVHEFRSVRSCSSVTVGWMPSADGGTLRYCARATEVVRHRRSADLPFAAKVNQCDLDRRLRADTNFAVLECRDLTSPQYKGVITQKITGLKPGKVYLIQITVKKPTTRSLSYDTVRVQTLSSCS